MTNEIDENKRVLNVYSANSVFNISHCNSCCLNPLDANVKAVIHRGYSLTAPENTFPAYTLAIEKGVSYVECEMLFTSDNVPVLLHDTTIDRTSNGTGAISELTLSYVKGLDFGSWKDVKYANTNI